MFQKQYLLNNFLKPSNQNGNQQLISNQHKKVVSYSPKIQYFSPRKNEQINPNHSHNANQKHPTINSPYQQSSQSYSQYYYQRGNQNNTHTITMTNNSQSYGTGGTSSHPSRITRTQTSRQKLYKNKMRSPQHIFDHKQNHKNQQNVLNSIDQQKQQLEKLKQKYSSQVLSSNMNSNKSISLKNGGNLLQSKNRLSDMKNNLNQLSKNQEKKSSKKFQTKNKHYMKTQYSRQKINNQHKQNNPSYPYTSSQGGIEQSSNNQTISFNNFKHDTISRTKSIRQNLKNHRKVEFSNTSEQQSRTYNQNNISNNLFHQYAVSPSQEYYSGTSNQYHSRNVNRSRNHHMQGDRRDNRQVYHSNSSSTINTHNRKASSLSYDRFTNKKMLTFYQCQAKKYFKYNDQGYLTNKQFYLRQKAQKVAYQYLEHLAIEQQQQDYSRTQQMNNIQKSKSLDRFPKLNKLKQQVDSQRKKLYQLYGKYHIQSQQSIQGTTKNIQSKYKSKIDRVFQISKQSKQKSYNPSQLPPSSSLSKKRFIVKHKSDQNQNILKQNQLLDDSYYERQSKNLQSIDIKKKISKKQYPPASVDNGVNDSSFLTEDKNRIKQTVKNGLRSSNSEYYTSSNRQSLSEGLSNHNKLNINGNSPKGISHIVGITSQQMLSSNRIQQSKRTLQNLQQSSISSINEGQSVTNSQKKNKLKNNSINKKVSQQSQVQNQQSTPNKNSSSRRQKFSQQSSLSHKSSSNQLSQSSQQNNSKFKRQSYSQHLQMINSNYKSPKTQSQMEINSKKSKNKKSSNLQIDSSLKLKTNTQKLNNYNMANNQYQNGLETNNQNQNIRPQTRQIKISPKINPSLTLQQDFQDQFQPNFQNPSNGYQQKQKSIKSSHLGLVKQQRKLQHKSSKNSHQSRSQSGISIQIQKKSHIKKQKWVREGSSNLHEHTQQINKIPSNMKKSKNNKISQVQNAKILKQSNQETQNQLKIDSNFVGGNNLNNNGIVGNRFSFEKNRPSFQSESINLNIDSAVHLPKNSANKYLQDYTQKIQERGQSKLVASKAEIVQTNSKNSMNSKQSKKQLSENVQQVNLLQEKAQKTRLAQQRQSFKSKTYSRHSSKKSNSGRKINLQRSINSQVSKKSKISQLSYNNNKLKYGEFLNVHNNKHSEYESSNTKSLSSSYNLNKNVGKSNKSQKIDKYSNYSQSQQNNQEQQMFFNLVQRAQQLLQLEDQLNQKRKQLQNSQIMTQQFQDILAKIQGHIYILRQILQVSTTAADIYSQDSLWVIKSSFLSIKKYILQRQKVVDCISGTNKKSCFKLSQYELLNEDLRQIINNQQIKQLIKDMSHCNELTKKFLEQYYDYLRQVFQQDFIQQNEKYINLKPFEDRYQLGVLLQQFRTEILALREKTNQSHQKTHTLSKKSIDRSSYQSHQQQSVLQQQTQQRMKKRIFKLMQVGFLLSQLTGNRIKVFNQQIDINEQFQEYFNDNWAYFQRIVKIFS